MEEKHECRDFFIAEAESQRGQILPEISKSQGPDNDFDPRVPKKL